MINLSVVGHSFFVDFVVALFVVSAVAYIVSFFSGKYIVECQARLFARWSLWVASGMTLIALVLGFYAYSVVGHDDMSHSLINEHRNIGSVLGLVIIVLGLWAGVLFNDDKEEGGRFVIVHVFFAVALLYVNWTGSLLVYQHGVGVNHLPNSESHNHETFKKIVDEKDSSSIIDTLLSR
ncbi:MAG: DUF2231 domain-containing protein [Gammaproteobacteria bacterium]|nr:DUF2231 domain-containing protein [Gammaproteobacteria bacterium]